MAYELTLADQLSSGPVFSTLWGGAGEDRVRAIAVRQEMNQPATELAFAAESSSPLLPDPSGSDSSHYSGGLDAAMVWMDPATRAVTRRSYAGGSRDERIFAAEYLDGLLYVAGSTSSADLPLIRPVHSGFGGGMTDGLLLRFTAERTLDLATYFGGGGDEAIHWICLGCISNDAASGLQLGIFGVTGSPSWPFSIRAGGLDQTPEPFKGGRDGFRAIVALEELPHTKTIAAPGWLGELPLGPFTQADAQLPLTLTVDDPSRLLLARHTTGSGEPSLTLTSQVFNASELSYLNYRQILGRALVDSGTVRIRVSAPGFADGEILVQLGTLVLYPSEPPARERIPLFSDVTISARPAIRIGDVYATPPTRPAINGQYPALPQYQTTVLTPETLRVNAGPTNINPQSVRAIQLGAARLRIVDESLPAEPYEWNGTVVPLQVATENPPVLGTNLQTFWDLSLNAAPLEPIAVRITSLDPDVIKLGGATTQSPVDSLTMTVPAAQFRPARLYLNSQGPARVGRLRFEGDGIATAEALIRIEPSDIVIRAVSGSQIALGQVGQFRIAGVVRYGNAGSAFSQEQNIRTGSPVRFDIASDDTSVAKPPASVNWPAGMDAAFLNVQGAGAGTATLSLFNPVGITLDRLPRFDVRVIDTRTAAAPIIVGRGLEQQVRLLDLMPDQLGASGMVTITSNRPDLLLLRNQATQSTSPSITYTGRFDQLIFGVAGAGIGEAELRIAALGGSWIVPVRVTPSAVVWASENAELRYPFPDRGLASLIQVVAIDPVTGLPLRRQSLATGVTPPQIVIESSAPEIATAEASSIASVIVKASALGNVWLRIVPPDGFVQPVRYHTMALKLLPGRLTPLTLNLGTGLQTGLVDSSGWGPTVPEITLKSEDPSRLLISSSRLAEGAPELRVSRSNFGEVVLQGLGTPGDVNLTILADNYEPLTIPVHIRRSSLVWVAGDNGYLLSSGQRLQEVTLVDGQQNFRLALSAGIWYNEDPSSLVSTTQTLNPTTGTLSIPVRVEPGNFLTLDQSTLLLNPGSSTATFSITARNPGRATVIASVPESFGSGPPPLPFSVQRPAIYSFGVRLGKDQQLATDVSFTQTAQAAPSGTVVTLRSTDPSRLLLSPAANEPGKAEIVYIVDPARRQSVYLQALAADGTAAVEATASGYEPGRWTVQLAPSFLKFDRSGSLPGNQLAQGGTFDLKVSLVVEPAPTAEADFPTPYGATLRAGVSIPVSLRSSARERALVEPGSAVLTNAQPQTTFKVRGVQPGPVTLDLEAADEYLERSPVASRQATFEVVVPALQLQTIYPGTVLTRFTSVQTFITIPGEYVPGPVPVTVRSPDPGKLLLSLTATETPAAKIELTGERGGCAVTFYLHAVGASGQGTITAEAPGFATSTQPVQLAEVSIVLDPSNVLFTTLSAPARLSAKLKPAGNLPAFDTLRLSPLAGTIDVALQSTNPAIGRIDPARVAMAPGSEFVEFTVTPLSVGSGLLSAVLPPVLASTSTQPTARLEVVAPSISASFGDPLYLGRYLQALANSSLNFTSDRALAVTIRSLAPQLLQVSAETGGGAPQTAITINVDAGFRRVAFRMHGLADSGTAQLAVEVAGNELTRLNVALTASGFAWDAVVNNPNAVAIVGPQATQSAAVGVYALPRRPGVVATIQQALSPLAPRDLVLRFSNSGPDVVSIVNDPAPLPMEASRINVSFRGLKQGTARLSIQQPPGFTPTADTDSLPVTVP